MDSSEKRISGLRETVIVHSSDLHVDDDVVGMAYNGLLGLRSVLATARALQADVVLLAGDTFDNHRVSPPVLRRTTELLAAAEMPVVMLPGNHDPAMPDCLYRRAGILDLIHVHVIGVTTPESVRFDEHGLEIWGHAHRDFSDMAPLRTPRPRVTQWQVVIAHGHYLPPEDWRLQGHRAWQITDPELAATRADYIALGHWDRAVSVGDGSVPAYYSGSPDLADTVNVVRLNPASGVTVRREPLIWT